MIFLLLLAFLGGCVLQEPSKEMHTVQEAVADTPLLETQWQLESLGDTPALPDLEATLIFEDGQVRGNGSCNSFGAPYTLEENRLTLGPIMSTLMACEEAIMQQEAAYLEALEQVRSYMLTEAHLVLLGQDDTMLLRFVAVQ